MEKNELLIPISVVLAGALVAGAIYFGGGSKPSLSPTPSKSTEVKVASVSSEDHILGNRNAPVVVVEYSDTECPFCKVFHNTMHQIVDEYEGQVAWVYRHFPIAQLHSKAQLEAEATECAAELGGPSAFWTYIDKVFEITNSNDSLDPSELPRIASGMGLDVAQFNSCLESGRYTEKIKKSIEDAIKSGARGTPYSIIISGNKKIVINGAEPIENVRAKIDSVLK